MARYDQGEATRKTRMEWWHEARFGMFIHWGLYAVLGRHEWVMNRERIPVKEYEKLTQQFKPKPNAADDWARLAKQAGMKYMVLTTKHHEGFCLWDTQQTEYNACRRGPQRDLVREYVEACRRHGLRIGFYYSLMDWHHPDGARCVRDDKARRRFLDFTRGCVRELMTKYGPIDILWYDVAWPLATPELWESAEMNAMVRELQPKIIINNRAKLPEDFGTPEEQIRAEEAGRAWEACMTFNGSWGYMPYAPPQDWRSTREVLGMLREVTAAGGNLLLNVGPAPDGSIPPEAVERLQPVGKWLAKYGEAAYGKLSCADTFEWCPLGAWTRKGKTAYFWCSRWPGKEIVIGGLRTKLLNASFLHNGNSISFQQSKGQLRLQGLPESSPDRIAGITVLKLEFAAKPRQTLGAGCVVLK